MGFFGSAAAWLCYRVCSIGYNHLAALQISVHWTQFGLESGGSQPPQETDRNSLALANVDPCQCGRLAGFRHAEEALFMV